MSEKADLNKLLLGDVELNEQMEWMRSADLKLRPEERHRFLEFLHNVRNLMRAAVQQNNELARRSDEIEQRTTKRAQNAMHYIQHSILVIETLNNELNSLYAHAAKWTGELDKYRSEAGLKPKIFRQVQRMNKKGRAAERELVQQGMEQFPEVYEKGKNKAKALQR
jgi:hypothetical protein